MNTLSFIFDWFIAFFDMPLAVPFIAGIAFLSIEMLEQKIMKG